MVARPTPGLSLILVGPILAIGLHLAVGPAQLSGQAESEAAETIPSVAAPSLAELGLLPGRPRITPTRTQDPPEIDGFLNDEVWRTAAHISDFTQQSPLDGAPATEATDAAAPTASAAP